MRVGKDEWNRSEKKKLNSPLRRRRNINKSGLFFLVGSVVDFDLFYYYYKKKTKLKVEFIRNLIEFMVHVENIKSSKFKLRRSCQVGRTYRFFKLLGWRPTFDCDVV